MSTTSLRAVRWLGIIGLIFGAIIVLALIAKSQDGGPAVAKQDITPYVAGEDWSKGAADGKLILTEYSDFQCPACLSFYPLVEQLIKDYPNDLLVVYRDYPLPMHQNAKAAAYAAEAAGLQGKYWEMHDILFENQSIWAEMADTASLFTAYAERLALDVEKFKADSQSDAVKDEVNKDMKSGNDAGVNSTPSFFLNGSSIENPKSYKAFTDLLAAKLAELNIAEPVVEEPTATE